jgi:hypothetical protein
MRVSTNFHPEWGYLAPTQSFIRTARIALVATTIGAIVGVGVGFSWISHQVTETSVAARTMVRTVEASSSRTQYPLPLASSGQLTRTPSSSDSSASSPTQAPEGVAALAEAPSGTDAPVKADTAALLAAAEPPSVDVTPMKKKVTMKPRVIWHYASRGEAHGHRRNVHYRSGSYYTSAARGGWDGYYMYGGAGYQDW